MIVENRKKIKVFLSKTSTDIEPYRATLSNVLRKAELDVVHPPQTEMNEIDSDQNQIRNLIRQAQCSIHILGNRYDVVKNAKQPLSYSELQFREAQKYHNETNENFKIFIWQPSSFSNSGMDSKQEQFVTSLKNNILQNITLSYHESPVNLVEDITTIMTLENAGNANVNETDIFFIYSELDEEPATAVLDLLNDVAKIEKFALSQNAPTDQTNFIVEQVKMSKLAVVFFKWSGDWALPFVQQLWKLVGGASSLTEILLIGDSNQESNQNKKINAPKVTSLLVAEELIPLEIKVQFDKINQNSQSV